MALPKQNASLPALIACSMVLTASGGCANWMPSWAKHVATRPTLENPFNRPAIVTANHTESVANTQPADSGLHRLPPVRAARAVDGPAPAKKRRDGRVRPASAEANALRDEAASTAAHFAPAPFQVTEEEELSQPGEGTPALRRDAAENLDAESVPKNPFPIDLANALALAGANSLEIELAREKILEAEAKYDQSAVLWLPSLRFGVGYNKHDGRLQETEGNVLEINRNSLFVGGGAGLADVPLAGGASGPARLMVNLSLADAAFEPLAACQLVVAETAASEAAEYNTLLEVATAYFDLVEAHAALANNEQAAAMAKQMQQHVATFAQEGFGSKAEVARAGTEAAYWGQAVEHARQMVAVRSAALARRVRLPADVALIPAEIRVVPVEVVDASVPVAALVDLGIARRPEIAQFDAIAEAARWRANQEEWRPWLPNVQVGASAGSFGGGPSTNFRQSAGRSDVDLLAVWELENLGLGTNARRRLRDSQHWQAEITSRLVRDHVAEEIVSAAAAVNGLRREIEIAHGAIAAAELSYRLNDERIHEGEGLPVEVIQSIRALAAARAAHAKAVLDFNRAEYRLLHAIGRPPAPPK